MSRFVRACKEGTNIVLFITCTYLSTKKSKGVSRQAEVAQEVPGNFRPRIFLTFRHYKGGRSSAKHTGRL